VAIDEEDGAVSGVGLVLGAGGVVGQAYQAGVLAALEETLGWDARTAALVVGSSAGSVTGTSLRMGIGAADLAAVATGTPLSPEGERLYARFLPDSSDLPVPPAGSWLRPWRLPSVALLARAARRPLAFRPGVAAMTLFPPGKVRIDARAEPLHRLVGDRWPERLWICTVRRTDGARVVFGRPGSPSSALAPAVLASCAIPGYFAPIDIGGVEYVDGGVHSATNADVLRTERLDVALVVAPMSTRRPRRRSPDGPLRWATHRRLDREARTLQSRGTMVVRFEPGPASLHAMGLRMMANDRSDRVVEAAIRETRAQVAADGLHGLLGHHHDERRGPAARSMPA
jgi:NTE family protein